MPPDRAPITEPAPAPASRLPGFTWFNNQPYLLLSLTSLFWAGNLVLGRFVVGHIPPFTLSCVRWAGALPIILPMAWPYLRRDWGAIRRALPLLIVLSATGYAANNVLAYYGLRYTEALNGLLIQSSGPLFVALWSLILFGVRLSLAQALGIAISLSGVFAILLHGDPATILHMHFNRGDIMLTMALVPAFRSSPYISATARANFGKQRARVNL